MKLLTVAVPVYNMEHLLPRCLASFARPDLAGLVEVIIVNDGSTDGTEKIARGFVRKMPAVFTLITQENAGHGGAVNTAMEHASGKYFRIVDADDFINTAALQPLLQLMGKTDADLIVDEKTEIGIVSGSRTHHPLPQSIPCGETLPFPQSFTRDISEFFMLHNVSVNRGLLKECAVRLLEHTFYVDHEFILAVTALAKSILFFRMPVYCYSVGSRHQSVSLQNYVQHYEDHLRVVRRCLELMKNHHDKAGNDYLFSRVSLLLNTHYDICLLYDMDRKRGRARARALHALLRSEAPSLLGATRKRYTAALVRNLLGGRTESSKKRLRAGQVKKKSS